MTMVPVNIQMIIFERQTRSMVVRAALNLNESGARFEVFENSRCNEAYWTRTANGGFLLNSTARPSAAIRDIYENGPLYGFECATAIIIIFYTAVLECLGDELFDKLFASLYMRDWHYDADLRLKITRGRAFRGDAVYFRNPDVNPETPQWQGENAIVITEQLYFGHGLGLTTGPRIIVALNRSRKPNSFRSAYLTDTVVQLDYPYLFSLVNQ